MPRQLIDLLAQMSHQINFSVGCYCELEERCHRRVLRELLADVRCGLAVLGAGEAVREQGVGARRA